MINDSDLRFWPHATAASAEDATRGDPVGVDLFDEEPADGFAITAIYVRFADGTRWPARTVHHFDEVRAARILAAWAARGPVHDYRVASLDARTLTLMALRHLPECAAHLVKPGMDVDDLRRIVATLYDSIRDEADAFIGPVRRDLRLRQLCQWFARFGRPDGWDREIHQESH